MSIGSINDIKFAQEMSTTTQQSFIITCQVKSAIRNLKFIWKMPYVIDSNVTLKMKEVAAMMYTFELHVKMNINNFKQNKLNISCSDTGTSKHLTVRGYCIVISNIMQY